MRQLIAIVVVAILLSGSLNAQVPSPVPGGLPKGVPGGSPKASGSPKEGEKPATETKAPAGTHELTAADVEAFLDGLVPAQLARDDIAGATVSVVKDGKLLFAKGYGYADYEKKTPVIADQTLFRPGSVSKLFTWTAVMQMYEQGKLDLDRDINDYLDFKIPDAFGKPITLKHILTHTAGFEGAIKDLISVGNESPNLGQYVKTHIPKRIFPPGTTPAYSNYATALAGYIVERVSGRPFVDYIDENILKPLGMTHSTFAQPLPAAFVPFMSNGYTRATEAPGQFEIVIAFPAGSLSSTATDMSRFMMAHLNGGELDGARILKPETAQLMHSRLFGLDPSTNGYAYGFYEESRNGHRIIGHGGDTQYFHSDLHLILDANVGFLVSYNSTGRGESSPRTLLWQNFLNRYFPFEVTRLDKPAGSDARAVSGKYLLSLRFESSLFKAFSLIGEFDVTPIDDGTIEVAQLLDPNGKPGHWRQTGPMTFREMDGQNTLTFKPNESGQMQMIVSIFPFYVLHRVGLGESKALLVPVVAIAIAIMLLTLILWPIAWMIRKYYGHKLDLMPIEWLLRFGVRGTFALNLVFVGLIGGLLTYGSSHLAFFSDRATSWFYVAQVFGVIGAIGTLLVLFNAFHSWRSRRRSIWGKLQATIFALASLGFLWFAWVGHLLKFSSNF